MPVSYSPIQSSSLAFIVVAQFAYFPKPLLLSFVAFSFRLNFTRHLRIAISFCLTFCTASIIDENLLANFVVYLLAITVFVFTIH